MIKAIIEEIKSRYKGSVPLEDAISYVEISYNLGKEEEKGQVEKSHKFRRFDLSMLDKFKDFKYIPNPYNGGDDDFLIVDMVFKEYTYGEYGSELFSDINSLNRDFKNYRISDLISLQYKT